MTPIIMSVRRVAGLLVLTTTACAAQAPATGSAVALAPGDLRTFFDCLRERKATVVAAHRGGPAPGFAENAIETFAHTTTQVPAVLEIDIARTKDNVLVLMHDDTLDRTTTGTGDVRAHTMAEIRAERLEDPDGRALDARVPTLREALDWAAGRAVLELDVKRGVAYEDVLAEVREANALSRVIFITYSTEAAVRVHRLAPTMMLSVSIDSLDTLADLERADVDITRVLAWTGTAEPDTTLTRALAARGIESMFGTLGNPSRSWDGRFAREGAGYATLARTTGLHLIASDRPVAAARELDAHDGVPGHALTTCLR
jgi:glycerophosphoryl diester phosphodiesterase